MTLGEFLTIDAPALVIAILACVACALVGNVLVLRRQALVGDAVSHAVLPGIVVGFLIAGDLAAGPMMAGAVIAVLVAAGAVELLRKLARLEPGAAMGVVFTVMFAAGVVMIETAVGDRVHLDTQHALFGSLEASLWIGPTDLSSLADPAVLAEIPPQIPMLAVVTLAVAAVMVLAYKEIQITTFDPMLADSLGLKTKSVTIGLIIAVAITAVASFEAVGTILVIAMFTCPPATARMLTDRLQSQIWLSVLIAVGVAVTGYAAAAWVPALMGLPSLGAAGMIAVIAGIAQTLAMLFAPRHGWLAKRRRRSAALPA